MDALDNFLRNNLAYILAALALFLFLLFIWNIFLQLKMKNIQRRSAAFFAGKKAANLEEVLLEQARSIKLLDKDIQELFEISNQINSLAKKSFHKSGLIRFNPFKDVGGNQSFSLAILDGKNNGMTISSLFTREGARVYAKSIVNGQTEKHPLTEEEKKAIAMAMNTEKKKLK